MKHEIELFENFNEIFREKEELYEEFFEIWEEEDSEESSYELENSLKEILSY